MKKSNAINVSLLGTRAHFVDQWSSEEKASLIKANILQATRGCA